MTRQQRIHAALDNLEAWGVIAPGHYSWSGGDRRKWVFTPAGHSERSLTTSQVEDFILGADAALATLDRTPGRI